MGQTEQNINKIYARAFKYYTFDLKTRQFEQPNWEMDGIIQPMTKKVIVAS